MLSAPKPTTTTIFVTFKLRSVSICRCKSVEPPTSTKHFGLTAAPSRRVPFPAARMIAFMKLCLSVEYHSSLVSRCVDFSIFAEQRRQKTRATVPHRMLSQDRFSQQPSPVPGPESDRCETYTAAHLRSVAPWQN